ncbi:adenomatous polyposis coli 2-like protein [Labeo rohita]|uniref:Adenomatous polyposis coli 2-like protein n=1 Tax=Labeo rohita TaxID=84645 RepID=A0A498LN43_LABRO|nr:adenomatous polyposis coli 2-like protein [Labeo rohita]
MMSYPTASYDQLVRQVEDLRKENSHLRRELQDNSHHLSKLENETSDMKEVLRQLQSKLEQEAGTLASSGRTDVLDQLKELHMDLTNYYELKYQPHNLRVFPETLASQVGEGEERMSIGRARSPVCPPSRQSSSASGEGTAVHPGHPHQTAGEGRVTAQHLEDLCKERSMLLSEIEKEERERRWYYSQLQGLSQRLAELPRLDTFSMQVDFIRQQLEFEAQQLRSVMEERFGTSDEMVQRTQIRVARLEQLEKELHEAQSSRGPQEKSALPETQSTECLSKASAPDTDTGNAGTLEAPGEAGSKVEMVFWLLSMLASRDREEMSRTLLAMSSSQESCIAMRKSGCVPLLVQILHEGGTGEAAGTGGYSREARSRASAALHNIVYSQPDEGQARREMRVLHVLEQIRSHCENGWDWIENHLNTPSPGGAKTTEIPEPVDPQMCQALCAIMKLSFEEEYRRAMNELGGLQAIAELMQLDQELHGMQNEPINMALRRYAGMALTNLTYGDVVNKESTLKSVLSALWNLSAHSTENKVAICSVDGALGFLVSTLTYRCQTNSLAIIESGGGILRNVSSLIATRDDYRQILRDHNCLQTLLQHLRSHSLTIVSNACGTLWNLSARSPKDQELLWDLGAVSMLRNLIHSKHKMIAMGSAAALRNLLTNRPLKYKDTAVISPGSCMPSLYMRKQKALEAELDAKHLAETFDSIEKQSFKHQSINKPLRHIESLAKDYASDSGCFDDDEAPNVSTSLDTGTFSMLSMFLNNSNFLNTQPRKREGEPEQDVETFQTENKRSQPPDDEVTVAAEKLAKKITNTVAKIDKLVEDITMHTSSEDSFSLSSEDHFVDWNYGPDELHEARAISCSPCHFSDTSSFSPKERLSRAHAFLRLKTANSSLSNDSLNSGSTSDGYCGSQDQTHMSAKPTEQRRPNKLDLKVAHEEPVNSGLHISRVMCQNEIPERDFETNKDPILPDLGSTDTEKSQEPFISTPATVSTKVSSDASIPTVKLSPSYQHVPLIQSVAKFGVAKTAINVQAAQAMRRQAWVPTVMTGGSISKFSPICSARSPTIGQLETPQKYSVENTPICFSRCSSLSSLSSGDGALDGQSQTENELESDSSLEIIEVEDVNVERKDEEDETLDDLSDSQLLLTDQKISSSEPAEIPSTIKNEKRFLRGVSPVILEDRTPSSSSENYIHETPLVMSRCSSVSSLGSFESPSIASSIQSDPCSEMISGTVSPSDLPDSPGQTMPPSRSKTPCCAESSGPETQNLSGVGSQWENSLRKFMEIADFKERFNLPPDLDTMIYFTVEKPIENFSCASSLSALPLHEHYVQKDVELKLTPLLNQQDNDPEDSEKEDDMDDQDQYSEGNSDDDIEILKECINSAMPSRFKKLRPTVMPNLSNQVLNMQTRKSVQLPVYMVLQNKNNQMNTGQKLGMSSKEIYHDDSSYTDSAEGTPINFSSTTSLSDETLQYPLRTKGMKDWRRNKETQELIDIEAKRIEDLRMFSRFHKPTKMTCQSHIVTNQLNKTIRHMVPTQRLLIQSKEMAAKMTQQRIQSQSPVRQIQKQGQNLSKSMPQLDIPCPPKSQQEHNQFEENSSPSSVSMDSEDDLLIKCITSAMPQHKKKQAARKKKAEKKHKQKAALQKATEWSPENDLDSDEMGSDKDSDLNSVEWRAIQEGANTIITKLQASKSQEPSSESESVMSFMSGSSFTPKEKKVYKDDKKANKPLDFAPRKPVPNLPVVFRGRTVIYTPKKETTLSQRPPTKKVTQKPDAPKNPDLAQHRSRSLHRLGNPMESTQFSLPKRSSTPPARIPKSSSSGSSQSSTPSRHPQKKVTSPTQTIKQSPEKVASAPCSPPDKRGSVSNTNQNSKSPIDRKTQKSPVRIPFMQNPSRQTRNISPLVTNQPTSISRQSTQMSGKRILPANRLDLVRMTSTYSSSGESDRNGFLRQLTFIKESSKASRRDASSRSVPTSQHASPRRAVPGAPAVFLCSSRCQELKEAVQGPRRMPVTQGQRQVQEQGVLRQGMAPTRAASIDRDVTVKRPARRTSSESPCRASQRNTPAPKPREKREDTFKRYSSSPSINVLSRVTSRSSLRSSSSDSSGRAKSERNASQRQQRAGSRNSDKVTWRRIRDEDVPQILRSTLPPTALPLLPSPEGPKQMPPPLPGKLPTITLASRKTSDATVQTEDYSANKTNSSTSPTIDKVLGITEEATKMVLPRKISMAFGNTLHDGDSDGSLKTYSTASTSTFQSMESTHSGGVGHFRQSSPSKAVRVTPFNYIPSPMVYCSPQTHGQAQTTLEKAGDKHEA